MITYEADQASPFLRRQRNPAAGAGVAAAAAGGAGSLVPPSQTKLEKIADVATMLFPLWALISGASRGGAMQVSAWEPSYIRHGGMHSHLIRSCAVPALLLFQDAPHSFSPAHSIG